MRKLISLSSSQARELRKQLLIVLIYDSSLASIKKALVELRDEFRRHPPDFQ
jgi:hypothetical protein